MPFVEVESREFLVRGDCRAAERLVAPAPVYWPLLVVTVVVSRWVLRRIEMSAVGEAEIEQVGIHRVGAAAQHGVLVPTWATPGSP